MKRRIILCFVVMILIIGCGRSIILLDKADYHYQNGLKLLNQGNVEGAKVEFEYAVFLDDSFAPAYVGMAIAYGTIGDLDKAVSAMKKAQELYRDIGKGRPRRQGQ